MQNSIFTSTFSKQIFHKFALQIYFTYMAAVRRQISSSVSWVIRPSSTR